MVNTAIILAGGFGTRLRSAVSDVPKPMAPIRGKPFLEYQLNYLVNQGITSIHLAVGYKHEIVIKYFGNSFKDCKLIYSIENQPLGTGGAFLKALKAIKIDQPLIIMNGDTFFPIDIKKFDFLCKRDSVDWGIALFRSEDLERYSGVVLGDSGAVLSLGKKFQNQLSLVNGGIYWLNPINGFNQRKFDAFGINSLISLEDQVLQEAIMNNQRVFGYEMENVFIDIGLPADYERASKLIIQ
jgi:D-glycero-alpha-D-manno-heptose 1-phosphate guanylyltransferase